MEQGHWEKVLEEGTGRGKNVQSAGNGLLAVESWRPLGQSKAFFSWLLSGHWVKGGRGRGPARPSPSCTGLDPCFPALAATSSACEGCAGSSLRGPGAGGENT